ncbi:MAG: hypothetical protein JWO32_3162 [Bacteroidetes bacterium]|nr:hypothetical protein [Bacteroidota bacterium]
MRSLFLFISFIIFSTLTSQTLYWVGGSGNFNDSRHWSLSSNGPSANFIPNSNTDVIFDDYSGQTLSFVNFSNVASVKSLKTVNGVNRISFSGPKTSTLNVHGSFQLSIGTQWNSETELNFDSNTSQQNIISFGFYNLRNNIKFGGGKFKINNIFQTAGNIVFEDGTYMFSKTAFSVNELIIHGNSSHFIIDTTFFVVKNKLVITDNCNFDTHKFSFYAPFSSQGRSFIPAQMTFGLGTKLTDNSISVACGATITTVPECAGSCSGIFSYTIDPSCGNPPYTMTVTNNDSSPNCQNTSTLLSSVGGPMTNTISGACNCLLQQYNVSIFDNSIFPIPFTINGQNTSNFNFNPPSFSLLTLSSKPPSCNASCNGTITLLASGGLGPYTVTVLPAIVPPVNTAGGFTLGGLCANVYTFNITDKNGCTSGPITKTVTAPPPVSTGSVATNIACNGSCTGSLVINPSGGNVGSYTVSFSTGNTFTVPSAGSASVTNLCVSAISATVTDTKGCTAVASTNITQPPIVNVTPTQTNLTCNAVCNGAASVAVTGGVAPYTYTWVPAGSSSAGVSGLCAGTQTVTIKNNGGQCTNTQTFNITQPTSITITPTITNIACNGFCTGSASVSGTGGTGAITFTWVGAGSTTISTTSSISGQCAGVYTVFAKDNNGCTVSSIITLTAAPAFTVSSSTQSVICFSQCNGAATVNVSGGNPPYTYTWAPATASTVAGGTTTGSNLCVGNYTVTVKDASLCAPAPVVLNIQQAPPINPNITTTSVTCFNACNGSINSAPSNGVGAYTFTLVTPTSASITTNPPYAGLCTGLYTLYIKDQNCKQSFTISITQPNPLVASVNVNSLTCNNVCNGSLAGSVNGGIPPYTFMWTTSTGTVAGGAIGSLCAGTYTFKATDFNGCSTSSIVTLSQPPAITATINATNPSCNTSCNGILSAVAGGGSPGYTLNWSDGFTGSPNTGLCAGNYTLNVTDSKGCTSPFTATLTAPPSITLTQTTSGPSCSGGCNGTATITASGGTPPFTYQFNTVPVTTNATGIIGGLCTGNYIVNVTDFKGCSQSINFSITNPPTLTPALTGLQSSCTNCTGSATVTPSGGVPGYTVSWTNSVNVVVGTGTAIANLCVGNYTASVTDSKGCVATVTANVVKTVSVTIVTGGTPIQCFGACTGSAVANPAGGTGAYTYTWNTTAPTQTTQTAVNLCAGAYTVFVADGLGCTNSATIALNNPAAIVVNTTQTNATCFGNCNGAISATATGGTGPLTYSWSPGGQTTSSINGLCTGGYTLTVKDGNNCSKVLTFSITQLGAIASTFTTTQPTGCGINNGSICATPSGGSGGPYTFSWSPVAGNASCLTGLGAGVYSLVISDGAGCTTTLSSLLTNPSGPTLTIGTTSVACNGGNTGSATVTALGTAPFGFTWTPIGVGFVNIGNTSIGSSLNSGTYAISVSQSNSCITTQTLNIATAPAFTVSSNVTNPKCNASCNGSITLVTSGGTPGYVFAWSSPTVTGVGTQTVTNLCAGPYTVNITDVNSCVKTQVFNVVNPPSVVLTNTASNVKCFGSCNGSVVANATGGTAPLTYTWLPVGAFTGSSTATVLNLCPAVYTVNAIDGNGCTATNTINITEPTQLTSTITSLNATCSNSCNATATLVAAGGTPGYAYSWSASGAITSTLGGLCPGTYSGTVSDLNGCSVVKSFTVTAPAPFTATLTSANPLCNSVCNGSISTALSGAQGTVSFNWTPVGVGQNPTGLCAGNYTLTATDAAQCKVNAIATLINPPSLLANVTTTNPACNGNCNGIALSSPANAAGAVTYSWIPTGPPTQTAQTANGLCAGNYTVTIKDGNGCQDVQTFTLTNPPLLNVNPSSAPATCSGSNGAITLLVSGGTPTYNFSWNPSVSTTSVANGLGAGIYTVVVIDSKNCTNTVTIPLSNSNGPTTAPITSSSISCNGQCTGAASINPAGITGGTAGYSISWISPPSPSTVNPLVNLCAGTYSAQITDALSCILFTAVTISEPAPITINPNIGLPTCNGICNGSVNLNPSGGTPGYNYTWTPVAPNSSVITNVCAGTLTVQIKDNNLCLITQTISVPGVQNITITTSTTSNVCFGNCAGSATITSITNGNAPFTESWSNGQMGTAASGLCNGTYSVIVTAANGCNNTFTASISSPAQITALTSIISPSCTLCNGSSTATAAGGTGPYTYSWTSGATGAMVNNLCAGLYQVLVTDNAGCAQIINVPISNVPGITGENFTVQNEQCAGACNGSATVQAVGGIAPITYTWMTNPAFTNSVAVSLCSGSYFVQMQDAQGCIRTSSTTIGSSPGLTLSPFISPPACTGPPNGTINIVPSGGAGTYTYNWLPSGSTSSSLTNIGPGNYTVTVTDGSCSKTQAYTISSFNNPSLTYTQTNATCFGACTGSIVALGSSTVGPVTYNWSTGSTLATLPNICPGIVTLTVTSTLDQCMALQSFTITDNPALQLSISNVQNVKCFGDCNGQITLIPSGGILPYTFTWSPAGVSNPQFSLCAGDYSATVIDSKGCSLTTTAAIVGPLQPIAITNTVTNSSCSTAADGSASITVNGGTPTYTFNWSGPATFTSSSQNINNILSGTYSLNTTDANGCTKTLTLQVVPTITVDANAGRDSVFCSGGSIVLNGSNSIGAAGGFNWTSISNTVSISNSPTVNVTPSVGSNTYVLMVVSSVSTCVDRDTVVVTSLSLPVVDAGPSYTISIFSSTVIGGSPTAPTATVFAWTPSGTLDNPTIPNPTASNTINTTYTVTVTDANGCTASDTMQVFLYPEIKIPNGFSPNGDSKNDKWIIDNIAQFTENVVEVYNRWGELLFYSKGYNVPFDGRYQGKDLPVGTYYYIINLNHPAYPKPYTGPLTIFR